MAMPEIDSFILKFKDLMLARKKAHLDINSENGKAVVNLTATVDVHPPIMNLSTPLRKL